MDDQQEPRRASLGLPRFARSGTPPTHVDDAGAGGRPECRKHANARRRYVHPPSAWVGDARGALVANGWEGTVAKRTDGRYR